MDFTTAPTLPLNALPSAPLSESALLSLVMRQASRIDEIQGLTPEDFHHPSHSAIWRVMQKMHRERKVIDLETLTQEMTNEGTLENIGGAFILTEIFTSVYTSSDLKYHVDVVKEKSLRREIIAVCEKINRTARDQQTSDIQSLLTEVESTWNALKVRGNTIAGSQSIRGFCDQAIDGIEEFYRLKGSINGVPTGFSKLDSVLCGLRGGQLMILAARPSIGKSALAVNIAVASAKAGHHTAIYTLEMAGRELATRMIFQASRIGLNRVQDGTLGKGDLMRVSNAVAGIYELPLTIDETSGISINELRSRARVLKKNNNLGLVVIDYLQLMKGDSKRGKENRHLEIAEITGGLKEMAKELDVPVIALSQLNRDVEKRKDGRPMLSDLRESGSIEQDADIVCLLHRKKEQQSEEADLLIAKNRSGVANVVVKLWFDGNTTTFNDYAQ